ncbi:MAG: hypothetical protein ACRDZO_15565 [Egibacteraceae bacterium]
MDENDTKDLTDYIPTRRATLRVERSRLPSIDWTNQLVGGVAGGALLVGLLAGLLLGQGGPEPALAEARQEIQLRDQSIDALNRRVATLETALSQRDPDAVRRVEAGGTSPSFDLPGVQDVVGWFSHLSEWVADTGSSLGGSLDDATRLANPATP